MRCTHVRKHLVPYAEGCLSEELRRRVHQHVESCQSCARELAEIAETVDVLRRTEYPAMEPASDLRSRVMSRIAQEPARKLWWAGKLQVYSAAAAGLVFIAFVITTIKPALFDDRIASVDKSGAPVRRAEVRSPAAKAPDRPSEVAEKAGEPARQAAKPERGNGDSLRLTDGRKGAAQPAPSAAFEGSEDSVRKNSSALGTLYRSTEESPYDSMPYSYDRFKSEETVYLGIGKEKTGTLGLGTREPDGLLALPGTPRPAGMDFAAAEQDEHRPDGMTNPPDKQDALGADSRHERTRSMTGSDTKASALPPPTAPAGPSATGAVDSVNAKPEGAARTWETSEILGLERKLRDAPDNKAALEGLLSAYQDAGRAQDEYATAKRLTSVDPNNPKYWFARGQAAERAKMPKTAMASYRQAVKLKLKEPELGLAEERLEALGKAK